MRGESGLGPGALAKLPLLLELQQCCGPSCARMPICALSRCLGWMCRAGWPLLAWQVLVDVLKQDWPHKWPAFIPEIVGASKTNETL